MRYRPLGQTGMNVSVLGFGASPLGGVFGSVDDDEAVRAVRTAIDLGINFFDVSPFYGLTKAETALGRGLSGVERDRFFVATKVGRYGEDEFDFSASRTVISVEESLKRLGVECIDLIQCHDMEFGSLDQVVKETLPALRVLRDQGKVRFVGITGLPLKIFRAVLDRSEADTALSYCHYTLYDTTLTGLLPYLREKRVGVINASPLGMGLLSGRPLPDWHPAPDDMREVCKMAAQHCRERNVELAQVALQFSLANPEISTTLIGIGSVADLKRNVQWSAAPPDAQLVAELQKILEPIRNKTWPSGRPENN